MDHWFQSLFNTLYALPCAMASLLRPSHQCWSIAINTTQSVKYATSWLTIASMGALSFDKGHWRPICTVVELYMLMCYSACTTFSTSGKFYIWSRGSFILFIFLSRISATSIGLTVQKDHVSVFVLLKGSVKLQELQKVPGVQNSTSSEFFVGFWSYVAC